MSFASGSQSVIQAKTISQGGESHDICRARAPTIEIGHPSASRPSDDRQGRRPALVFLQENRLIDPLNRALLRSSPRCPLLGTDHPFCSDTRGLPMPPKVAAFACRCSWSASLSGCADMHRQGIGGLPEIDNHSRYPRPRFHADSPSPVLVANPRYLRSTSKQTSRSL